jgi:hypothetical protein
MELISLRKIRRICPRSCGPGPLASAHGSTDFIKLCPLAFGSMAQIEPSEPVSRLLISAVHHGPMVEEAGSGRRRRRIALMVARHGRARRLTGVRVFSSYGFWFLMRFVPTGSQLQGERDYANLNHWRVATGPSNGEASRPVLGDGEGGIR